jgi:hypothetical protein
VDEDVARSLTLGDEAVSLVGIEPLHRRIEEVALGVYRRLAAVETAEIAPHGAPFDGLGSAGIEIDDANRLQPLWPLHYFANDRGTLVYAVEAGLTQRREMEKHISPAIARCYEPKALDCVKPLYRAGKFKGLRIKIFGALLILLHRHTCPTQLILFRAIV